MGAPRAASSQGLPRSVPAGEEPLRNSNALNEVAAEPRHRPRGAADRRRTKGDSEGGSASARTPLRLRSDAAGLVRPCRVLAVTGTPGSGAPPDRDALYGPFGRFSGTTIGCEMHRLLKRGARDGGERQLVRELSADIRALYNLRLLREDELCIRDLARAAQAFTIRRGPVLVAEPLRDAAGNVVSARARQRENGTVASVCLLLAAGSDPEEWSFLPERAACNKNRE